MNHTKSKLSLLFFSADYFLFITVFFALNYFKRESLKLPKDYTGLMIGFLVISLIVSLFTKKLHPGYYRTFFRGLFILAKSMVLTLYGISFFVVVASLSKFSRIHIFGTCAAWLILEMILFAVYYESLGKDIIKKLGQLDIDSFLRPRVSYFILFSDLFLLMLSFFMLNLYKTHSLVLRPSYEKVFLIVVGLWLFISIITRKFDFNNFQNYFFALAACMKAVILMVFIVSILKKR